MTSSDIPSYNEPYTENSAIEFISKAVDKCNELKDLKYIDSLHTVLKSLSASYFDFKVHRQKMCDIMIKKKYVEIKGTILDNLLRLGYFSNDPVWFTTYYAYNALWNFSDFNQEIATSILSTSIPKILLGNLLHKPYLNNLNNTNTLYLIKSSLSIVHNIARFPGNKGPFNVAEFKNTMILLIKRNSSDFLGTIALLCLSVLVDETELQMLEEGENSIVALITRIKTAMGKADKRVDGFMVWELVNGLRCITANDNMKKTIVKEGGLQVLIDVLKNPSNDDDIEKSLGALWNMCFDKEIRQSLKTQYDIKGVIKSFENHPSSEIKKNYNGIIWLMDNKSQSVQRVKSASLNKLKSTQPKEEWKFHIFFSYAWANKTTVMNIRDELIKSKIKIWIDVDQMMGSTLEAMADGIENSKIFVMAVSEAYRTSPNCRTEAEYAFSLRKPIIPVVMENKYKPTSWLGMIMGSKTYYEFSERRVFQVTLVSLLKNITEILNNCVEDIIVPRHAESVQRDVTDSVVLTSNFNISDKWSKEDVGKWLTKSSLNGLRPKFAEIDGVLLGAMIEMSTVSPDYLYHSLKTEFEMKLIDVLRFNVAIKNLSLQ